MAKFALFFVVLLSGAVLPIQFAVNSKLRGAVQSPALSALISFAVGALALLILTLSGVFGRGRLVGLGPQPWWIWIGGFCGAFLVIASIIGLPKIGSSGVVAATVLGQLVMALVLDHFGWLGVPQVKINGWRILGAALLFGGALLVQKK